MGDVVTPPKTQAGRKRMVETPLLRGAFLPPFHQIGVLSARYCGVLEEMGSRPPRTPEQDSKTGGVGGNTNRYRRPARSVSRSVPENVRPPRMEKIPYRPSGIPLRKEGWEYSDIPRLRRGRTVGMSGIPRRRADQYVSYRLPGRESETLPSRTRHRGSVVRGFPGEGVRISRFRPHARKVRSRFV
ncbi:MAG: hypothetical protein QG650_93 [Patescibacteria group bacterium]|nr:hypothetical protein [Patescibacteria group bacterium]